ncbi:MAG TPA: response regulator, partial [Gaiellaceae bacterium]|nr:response regulator [Gaiellaceae bacterium]
MARLLIVDDEEPLRRALRHTLSRAGHDVLEAASVVGARDVLSREPGIELVFCDLGMPDGSGMELLRSLDGSDIAVVILTGHDDPALAETALAIGAYGYVVKPVSPNEIQISAATALRRRELELARRDYVHELENKVLRRTAALRDALDGLRESEANARMAAADTVDRLVSALALRNEETGAHIQRVGLYAAWLAAMTDICPWAEQEIRLAA